MTVQIQDKTIVCDLKKPIDISIPLTGSNKNLTAWYQGMPIINPVKGDGYIGSVKEGGSVNFNEITFVPHAHATHTECVGHISKEYVSINDVLKDYFFISQVITITPKKIGDDRVITLDAIKLALEKQNRYSPKALIIRTIPNDDEKKYLQYSHTNPPYFERDVALYLIEIGIEHILVDTPSVDKEVDGGALLFHHTFWEYPKKKLSTRTITEFVFVPNEVLDGLYLLDIQLAPIENNASISRPVLYAFL